MRIEQIEDLDLRPQAFKFIASFQVDQGGRLGAHTIVLNERPWAEIAGAKTAEQTIGQIDRGASGNHRFNGTWNIVAGGVVFAKSRMGIGYVEIQSQPGERFIKIGPLHAIATTGTARLRDSSIA